MNKWNIVGYAFTIGMSFLIFSLALGAPAYFSLAVGMILWGIWKLEVVFSKLLKIFSSLLEASKHMDITIKKNKKGVK